MTAFYAEFYNLDPYLATRISEDVAHGDSDRSFRSTPRRARSRT
jgi:hypothetical protein